MAERSLNNVPPPGMYYDTDQMGGPGTPLTEAARKNLEKLLNEPLEETKIRDEFRAAIRGITAGALNEYDAQIPQDKIQLLRTVLNYHIDQEKATPLRE